MRTWGLNAVKDLAAKYEHCKMCPALVESRTQVVFGAGNVRSDVMIIGASPDATEDEEGDPFLGNAGRLLMDLLRSVWPEVDEISALEDIPDGDDDDFFEELRDYLDDHIFWTNATLCWPEDSRDPSNREIKACKERLHQVIYAVDPMLIIMAGRIAATALVGKKVAITSKRGTIFDITIKSPSTGRDVRYPALAILHPSYLLRQGDQGLISRKEGSSYDTLEDLQYGLDIVNEHYNTLWGTDFPYRPENYKR